MKLIGKIICAVTGKHKRGTFVRTTLDQRFYRCGRCGNETKYKIKPPKPQPGNNGAPGDEA